MQSLAADRLLREQRTPRERASTAPGCKRHWDARRERGIRYALAVHTLQRKKNRSASPTSTGAFTRNTVENFWSCVKRTLHGTYIAVRPSHLNAYLDEQVFRFNGREGNDADRFAAALKATDGKRVTYATLTASHPRWRLRPGRAARAAARRAMIAQEPIGGKSDRI